MESNLSGSASPFLLADRLPDGYKSCLCLISINQLPQSCPSVFVLELIGTKCFRAGDDLVYNVSLSLKNSLVGTDITVPLIDSPRGLDIR